MGPRRNGSRRNGIPAKRVPAKRDPAKRDSGETGSRRNGTPGETGLRRNGIPAKRVPAKRDSGETDLFHMYICCGDICTFFVYRGVASIKGGLVQCMLSVLRGPEHAHRAQVVSTQAESPSIALGNSYVHLGVSFIKVFDH